MNENGATPERHVPTALKRNRSYETYQLHAKVGWKVGVKPEEIFRAAIGQVLQWLIQRFRDAGVPEELAKYQTPGVPDFADLESVHLDEGYIIDISFLPDEGVWALHLAEADQGSPGCPPEPGRTFETYFSFRHNARDVDFATKTVCSQPDDLKEICEVFRPAVVSWLYEDLGLEHQWKIGPEPHASLEGVERKTFKCGMPIALFSGSWPDLPAIARKLQGFAQVFHLKGDELKKWNELAPGFAEKFYAKLGEEPTAGFALGARDGLVIYPYGSGMFPARYRPVTRMEEIVGDVTRCNVERKGLDFNKVPFYAEARQIELAKLEKTYADAHDLTGVVGAFDEQVRALRRENERLRRENARLADQVRAERQKANDWKGKRPDGGEAPSGKVREEDYVETPAESLGAWCARKRIVFFGGSECFEFCRALKAAHPELVMIEGADDHFDPARIEGADFAFLFKDSMSHTAHYRSEGALRRVPHALLSAKRNVPMLENAMANVLARHFGG